MTISRRATVDDASHVADVMKSVISEGKYTLSDRPFSEAEERAFISSSLGDRRAVYVAEIEIQVLADNDAALRFYRNLGFRAPGRKSGARGVQGHVGSVNRRQQGRRDTKNH
jgi:hypothetical protein